MEISRATYTADVISSFIQNEGQMEIIASVLYSGNQRVIILYKRIIAEGSTHEVGTRPS